MKTIDTLVEDIYSLFASDTKTTIKEEDLKALVDGISHAVTSALSERTERNNLRLSMIGHPDRKVWYNIKGAPKRSLSGPTMIKFLYGDILEQLLIFLTKTAGHTLEDPQKEVEVSGVKGHHDAIVDGVLVDFKSASPYSFKKFKEGTILNDDPFGYIAQISAYSKANNKPDAGFVAIDKVSGEIVFCPIHAMEMINPDIRIEELKALLEDDSPPSRCYDAVPDGKFGNMRLSVGCSFCDYRDHCWSDANNGVGIRTFMYSNGPRHFVQVVKEPDVPEVKDA